MNTHNHSKTADAIKQLLLQRIKNVQSVQVINDSQRHASHAAAKKNPRKGHFIVHVSLSKPCPLSRVQQHRAIYQAVAPQMPYIHALNIHIKSKDM